MNLWLLLIVNAVRYVDLLAFKNDAFRSNGEAFRLHETNIMYDGTDYNDDDILTLLQVGKKSSTVKLGVSHSLAVYDPLGEVSPKVQTMNASVIVSPSQTPCSLGSVTIKDCQIDWSRLQHVQMPVPALRTGTALVKVVGSTVNPCEWKGPLLSNNDFGTPLVYPYVTGMDFSGIIDSTLGPCGSFVAGDEVWGTARGSHAEYMVVECSGLGRKPKTLSLLQAGTLGIAAMTGLEGFARYGGAPWSAPVTVLVIGGSSGTGHFGIQLAKAFGAGKVITTCSPENNALVRSLGADEVIDFHKTDWWDAIPAGTVDVIYDCMSFPKSGNHAYKILADGGKYVSILPEALADKSHQKLRPSISQATFIMSWVDNGEHLQRLTDIANAGNLTAVIDQVFTRLDKVPQLFNTSLQGHTVGKLALRIDSA